ncbi:MAG: DNA replication and repair protein RecF, partial [Clostridia bacterium]|nr:DNA replication and repair protein RecF [Clostridia bacterium]
HRDDISIKINDIDVRKFGSQGQKRTTALSLKLAEVKLFESETGEKPILILDDVLSELDSRRQIKLLENIQDLQTLLTCAEYNGKEESISLMIKVSDGKACVVEK